MVKNIPAATKAGMIAGLILFLPILSVIPYGKAAATAPYNASDVLGQPDYTSSNPNNDPVSTNATSVDRPISTALDGVHHHLYILDSDNRVTVFNLNSSNQIVSRTANYVIGQANFTSSAQAVTQNGFDAANDIALDIPGQRLFVADSLGNRVLEFDVSSLSTGMPASHILGQSSYSASASGSTATSFNRPSHVAYDPSGQRLFVDDESNYRVLVFNVATITDDQAAVHVLGQANPNSYVYPGNAPNATAVHGGYMTYDTTANKLFVADGTFSRVMVFPAATITDDESATNVLGEANLNSNSPLSGLQAVGSVRDGLAIDTTGRRLFVSNPGSSLVYSFPISSISNGESATNFLGRSSLSAPYPQHPSATTLDQADGLSYDPVSGELAVADYINMRLALFNVTSITNGQAAIDEIGQTDAIGNAVFSTDNYDNEMPNATGVNDPNSTLIDPTYHHLFVADTFNNRVLVFNLDSNDNLVSHTAAYVLGQPDFTSRIGSASQTGMWGPEQLGYDPLRHWLFVTDTMNSRILVFDASNIQTNEPASYELGQVDFNSNVDDTNPDPAGLGQPAGLAYDPNNQTLWVGDSNNDRAISFDMTNPTNGEAATHVIGQTDLSSSGFSNPQTIEYPQQMAFDPVGNRLFMNDGFFDDRVLEYDMSNFTDNELASHVIGEPNFNTSWNPTAPCSQSYGGEIMGIAFDSVNNQLLVGDGCNRLDFFDTSNLTDGENATAEFGQSGFVDTSNGGSPSQSGFAGASGVDIDPATGTIYMADDSNNLAYYDNQDARVLEWKLAHVDSSMIGSGTVGTEYNATVSTPGAQGSVSLSVAAGALPPGLTMSSGGVISGTPTTTGTYNFTIQVSDNNSGAGIFKTLNSESITIANAPPSPPPSNSSPANAYSSPTQAPASTPTPTTSPTPGIILNVQPGYTTDSGTIQTLAQGQAVAFSVPDPNSPSTLEPVDHHVTVDSVGSNYADITIASNPINFRLYIGQSQSEDVNGDGIPDIWVKLLGVTNGQAQLVFKQLTASASPSPNPTVSPMIQTNPEKAVPQPGLSGLAWLIWTGLGAVVLILGLVGALLFRRSRNQPPNLS